MFDLSWKNNGVFGCLALFPLLMLILITLAGVFTLGYLSREYGVF